MGQIMMHTALETGTLGRCAFLLESPESVSVIAQCLEDAREIAYHREYRTVSGVLEGERVIATSVGMGGPSADIGMEELHKCGADTMIFIGSGYALSDRVRPGGIMIPTGAVRAEGVSMHYLLPEYPAVPDYEVAKCLKAAAQESGEPCEMGITVTTASLYTMQEADARPYAADLRARWDAYRRGGALMMDMDSAVLFSVAQTLSVRAGAVLFCEDTDGADSASQADCEALGKAVRTAVRAMGRIIRQNAGKTEQ